MKDDVLARWRHSHSFGQDKKRPGETRTFIVIALTASMMLAEIVGGIVFGSMALLADGLHMGSHAVALSINAFAYIYARRHAHNARFSFGTGKVNTLGGYTGAILLALFAALMAWESLIRLLNPVEIAFNQAIWVASIGLLVNGASVFILGEHHEHSHDHEDHHDHHDHHHDHNLRSAYLHVLADALTSLLAIFALLIGKYYGAVWMDPVMGIVGAILVSRWSLSLLKSTSAILLDEQGSQDITQRIHEAIEFNGDHRIVDLHLWTVGPGIYASVLSIVSRSPAEPRYFKSLLPENLPIQHISIEVHSYDEDG
ncbi:MAG: CDF family Co(II)/Ni(II) efflux transporter DmeF [Pseudomonadales bacterium]|jgi:cation diffusion facilitator family transporter|nr:CDF family Co(II)/Ni(II) efflux transporter DmeF [Pseudomonadales bacterium]